MEHMTAMLIAKFKLNHEPPQQHHLDTTMSNPAASLTAAQIRRRANDYDAQIRLGLEEGNIRQVVKRLGADLVSKKILYLPLC
jgi:hypothetical protein